MGRTKTKCRNSALNSIAMMLLFLFPLSVHAGTVSLPQTGQTQCFNTDGEEIPCTGTGQDGEIRAGLPWPDLRFTNNGNGTITDNLTGLIWDQNAGGNYYPDWQDALDAVKNLNATKYKGFSDWRLPNVFELESLMMNYPAGQAPHVYLAAQGFSGVSESGYWTSTTSAYYYGDPDNIVQYYQAFYVAPGYGIYVYPKVNGNLYLWAVRGKTRGPAQVPRTGISICTDSGGAIIPCAGTGQDGELQEGVPWPAERFTTVYCSSTGLCTDQGSDCDANASNDAVRDNLTNRMWSRNASPLGSEGTIWQQVLGAMQTLNSSGGLCGYTDWRLPNQKEFLSLFDYSQVKPVLSTGHPFTNVQNYNRYWTSTSSGHQPFAAMASGFYTGGMYPENKTYEYGYYWPVRTAAIGPDLFVLLSTPKTLVQTGNPLPYTIKVTNYGPGAASNVALTAALPAGVVYGSHTASQGTCSYAGGTLTCSFGEIAQSGTVTITLDTTAPAIPGTAVHSATVTTTSADPNLTNNQTDLSVRVSDTMFTLTVIKEGNGDGTVSGGGIDCGSTCSSAVFEQSGVTLTAVPDSQSAFLGWSGAGCTGKGPCQIAMDGNKTVTALFNKTVGSVMLPKTGVTTSYAAGDDGALQRGASWPTPRFTVVRCNQSGPCADQNADCDYGETVTGTDVVIDRLTGLMWMRDGNYFDWPTNGTTLSFVFLNLNDYINVPDSGYNICGYHDWRVPNVNEMASLVNPGQAPEWLNTQGFVDMKRQYWTSTTSVYSPSEGWYVNLAGNIWRTGKAAGSERPFFILVRDSMIAPRSQVARTGQTACYSDSGSVINCTGTGQDGELQRGVAAPSPRFTNPNGSTPANQDVVLDRLTFLMWTRDAYLPGELKTWQGALDFVAGLNSSAYGGYSDWRLPNLFELRSLQDYSQAYPGLPADHPFVNVPVGVGYWTSDTVHGYATDAWTVWMEGYMAGSFGINIKASEPRWVWAVRGGAPNAAPGDLNLNGSIDLADAILALQVMSGASTTDHPQINYADVNQDSRIGMPEAIFVLQEMLGLR
jgi:uncharacterized repeat protein (TIGR01451 family)